MCTSLQAQPSVPLERKTIRTPASGSIRKTNSFGSACCTSAKKERDGTRRKMTRTSVALAASDFPARMKKGTPAQRQLSTFRRRATYVSVLESALTPGTS